MPAPSQLGDAFGVFHAPSFGAILLFGLLLMAIFVAWLYARSDLRCDPRADQPASVGGFIHDVFMTKRAGR